MEPEQAFYRIPYMHKPNKQNHVPRPKPLAHSQDNINPNNPPFKLDLVISLDLTSLQVYEFIWI